MSASLAFPLLSACVAGGETAPATAGPGRAALLVPLEGRASELGQIMAQAASLAAATPGFDPEIAVRDTGDTPETAAAAAAAARADGARIILGPLFGAQARAVHEAAGPDLPVVTFSNDPSLLGSGVFVFGVTPAQSAQAVLGFAAGRGLRRVGLAVPEGPFGDRAVPEIRAVARQLRLDLLRPLVGAAPGDLLDGLRRAGGGTLPDAVYLPSAGPELTSYAAALRGSGVQVLGSAQWLSVDPAAVPGLESAWFAAPDPTRFRPFQEAFARRSDAQPGLIAGLAFDAVEAARILGRIGRQNRAGLLREQGFDGVLGPFRFLPDGRVARGLAVLGVEDGALTLLGATGV